MLVEENFDVKNLTSFKTGGCVKRVFFPENIEEFIECLKENPDAFIYGNLTNTIVSSGGFDGKLILTTKMTGFKINGCIVTAECGVSGAKLSQAVCEAGLSGLEFMAAFPGSVGGEVFMNAGAHGQAVGGTFVKGKFFDTAKGEVIILNKDEMEFCYRTSICQKRNLTVLNAVFELTPADTEQIKAKMRENIEFRHMHQPSLAMPNCGSVFKNQGGISSGRLLDEAGAKNFSEGNVKVWKNHANFIINEGGTSTDILELMLKMHNAVSEKTGVVLEPEVRYLGNKNKREEDICTILYQNFKKM